MAGKIATAIQENGYSFLTPPVTNQLFPILPQSLIEQLSEKYVFYEWKVMDDQHSVVRLITSWATDEHMVDELIHDLNAWHQ